MTELSGLLAKPIRWLLTTRDPLPDPIRGQLESGLFTSLPIFIGGVLNSIAIAAIAVWRHPVEPFIAWLALEVFLAVVRLPLILWSRRALRAGRRPPSELAAFLACGWAASVGFGAFISVTSGDWILATIVCLSAAAMVCGICLRNFGTPRLAATMGLLTLGPCAAGGIFAAEPIIAVIGAQLPIFIFTIFASAFSLHRLMVSHMAALADLEKSESFNRTILESSPDYTLILDEKHDIVFCNEPNSPAESNMQLIGRHWLSLLPPQERMSGEEVLARVAEGEPGNLVTSYTDQAGNKRWFDIIAKKIADDSGRIIVVARDITHQKSSEEQALWMARHDPLTHLPNRAVLLDRLDSKIGKSARQADVRCALMIVDIDHFKSVNDTLGHDAGDALLCNFAERLSSSLGDDGLVARTGGDEFALLVPDASEEEVTRIAAKIQDALAPPYHHEGRLLQCGASIGASLLPRDGATASEIMKAADIALYAAKAAGRAQLKVFEPSMKAEVEHRDLMMASAREALRQNRVHPCFQPKICLRTAQIVGFEALLRWTDATGALRGPEELKTALEDSTLGMALGEQMIEHTLDEMQAWLAQGVEFGHVALNVTAADFRRERFAEEMLGSLAARRIPPACLQVEVTETVFLGQGSEHVLKALMALSDAGVRVALDDFGTGYASLSHLNQFPVDLLKIDRSFISQLGRNADAEAICTAVINLGHCLGLEIVAEGVETAAQEERLIALGCDAGQGFLYTVAVPADAVPPMLADWARKPRRVASAA